MKVEWLENNMLHLDIKNILNQFEVRDEWICNWWLDKKVNHQYFRLYIEYHLVQPLISSFLVMELDLQNFFLTTLSLFSDLSTHYTQLQ